MRPSRDLLIVAGLFAVLFGLTIFTAARRADLEAQREVFIPYSSYSARDNGTLGLFRWLEDTGYRVARIEGGSFRVPETARALVVFPALAPYDEAEAQALLRWVERGNTLVLLMEARFGDNRLWRALKARAQPAAYAERAVLEQPLPNAEAGELRVNAAAALEMDRADYVRYAGTAADKPLIVSWAEGRGRVFALAAPYLFTNDGLRHQANAALVRALLPAPGALVAFDEYHLNPNREAPSLQGIVYNTPWGWALIYALVVVFAYLLINGQRFGRVVPLPQELARRSPAEYVVALAGLFRRAGKQQMALNHYKQQLKRSLGKPYQISPGLPDDDFVRELSRYRDVDQAALLRMLGALSQARIGERALVRLADESVKLRRKTDDL